MLHVPVIISPCVGMSSTLPSDHDVHTATLATPTEFLAEQTTPPNTDLPQSEPRPFNVAIIIAVVVGVGMVIAGCLAAVFIALMVVAMQKRKGKQSLTYIR